MRRPDPAVWKAGRPFRRRLVSSPAAAASSRPPPLRAPLHRAHRSAAATSSPRLVQSPPAPTDRPERSSCTAGPWPRAPPRRRPWCGDSGGHGGRRRCSLCTPPRRSLVLAAARPAPLLAARRPLWLLEDDLQASATAGGSQLWLPPLSRTPAPFLPPARRLPLLLCTRELRRGATLSDAWRRGGAAHGGRARDRYLLVVPKWLEAPFFGGGDAGQQRAVVCARAALSRTRRGLRSSRRWPLGMWLRHGLFWTFDGGASKFQAHPG
ncbi:hypothetical protein PVAP13_2NG513906 [Panicum virgatum]|uniref:Uncharacterized protein n=1 Tax=Panicum virgatum TaxID=38727 RepID=A0A8T0W1G9_PANVG|nr:hypothetical protein PVAP13_2NG513906 [Panicum virgatum]